MIIGIEAEKARRLGLTPAQVEVQVLAGLIDLFAVHGEPIRFFRWTDGTLEVDINAGQATAPYFITEGLVTYNGPPRGSQSNPIKICPNERHHCFEGCGCGCACDRGFLIDEDREGELLHTSCNDNL